MAEKIDTWAENRVQEIIDLLQIPAEDLCKYLAWAYTMCWAIHLSGKYAENGWTPNLLILLILQPIISLSMYLKLNKTLTAIPVVRALRVAVLLMTFANIVELIVVGHGMVFAVLDDVVFTLYIYVGSCKPPRKRDRKLHKFAFNH